LISLFLAIYVVFLGFIYVDKNFVAGTDFISFRIGAKILISQDRLSMYDTSVQKEFQKERVDLGGTLLAYKNPPPLAAVFIPFAHLSPVAGYRIFLIFNILVLILAVFILVKQFFPKQDLLYYLIPFVFWPVILTLFTGQISILLLILFICLYSILKSDKPLKLGLTSTLLLLKPQYLIFIPFLFILIRKKTEFIKGLAIGAILFSIIVVMISGADFFQVYPRFLIATESSEFGSNTLGYVGLVSLMLFAGDYLNLPGFLAYAVNFLFYVSALYFFSKFRSGKLPYLFSAGIFFTVSLSVHTWAHDLVLLLIPIYLLLQKIEKNNFKAYKAIILLIIVIFISNSVLRIVSFFIPLDFVGSGKYLKPILLLLGGVMFMQLAKTDLKIRNKNDFLKMIR
jgi:hypothetical protein